MAPPPLTINSNGEITGTLNFSQTVMEGTATATSIKATFAEFELSDYAMLIADAQEDANLFSNGDIDGDGVVDDIDDKWGQRWQATSMWRMTTTRTTTTGSSIFERVENATPGCEGFMLPMASPSAMRWTACWLRLRTALTK